LEPHSVFLTANRLKLHLLDWGGDGPVVLLLHGFLEHAHVWDRVAPTIAAGGYRVLALDWRGHGDSEWVGPGGYYHFADYVADLGALVRHFGGRAALVAHSMGGNAAILYAGTEPERAWALASIEGVGPPDSEPASAPDRFAAWIDDLERAATRPRLGFSMDGAVERLRLSYRRLDGPSIGLLAEHGTKEEGAERVWKFDPLHHTRSPQPFYVRQGEAFWRRVTCPVLYVEGAESILRLDDADVSARLSALRARRVTIAGCGHHPHLERPAELGRALVEFLDAARPAASS
jgi:pimeloyl-ACP methyl ester carboxylesterase